MHPRPFPRAALPFAVVLCAASPLLADTLCLKDGRVIEGKPLTREGETIRVKFEHGEVVVPKEMVLDVLIDAEAADAAKGAAIAKRIADRKAYVEQIKLLGEWRNRKKESTAHFDFESTVPPHIFTGYRDLMEAYFTDFAKKWKVSIPQGSKLVVCFYGREDEFHQVGGVSPGVLGYFKPWTPYELNIYYERTDAALSEAVMFHEANHYLQKLLNVQFDMPHFPGESLAEYYGASHWDPKTKKLTIGLVQEGRLAEVQDDVAAGNMFSLEKMLNGATDRGMYEHYTWGWSFVHFLMNRDKYAAKFQRFVTTLATGKDVKREPASGHDNSAGVEASEVVRVFMKCLELKDKAALAALEKEWHAYVKDELKADSLRGVEMAGLQVASSYPARPLRATKLLKTAVEKGSRNPRIYTQLAELVASGEGGDKSDFKGAVDLLKKAIELDPLAAETYADLGRLYQHEGKKDEGKNLLKLALELDPDNPWLEFSLRDR
jgi:tetratricopeptide (TPR) repeat protein